MGTEIMLKRTHEENTCDIGKSIPNAEENIRRYRYIHQAHKPPPDRMAN